MTQGGLRTCSPLLGQRFAENEIGRAEAADEVGKYYL